MKVKKYDGLECRKILTGMITNRQVCAAIARHWSFDGLFEAQWANRVGTLAVRHFQKFDNCPGNQMRSVFQDWAAKTIEPPEVVEAIEKFLVAMSDENHQDSPEYLIDLSGNYFNRVKFLELMQEAKRLLDNGEVDSVWDYIRTIRRLNLGEKSFVDVLEDEDAWPDAFKIDRERPLVYYRDALGDFIGNALQRGRFFSFMAPDKSGKTTWMVDFVYRAVRNGNCVAFFDVGDSSEKEFIRSLASRVSGRPLFPGQFKYPQQWGDESIDYQNIEADEFDPVAAYREFMRICRGGGKLRMQFHPSGTFSAGDLENALDDWSVLNDWRPDVVVVDYADILAPPKGFKDTIDQVDETWKQLRRISQKRHCLVMTATQASALAYSRGDSVLSKKHFSGRKTKMAHVSGMIGINVTDQERENGMCRINKFAWRHGKHSEREFVRVAGCYDIGNPAILSKR